MKLFQRCSVGLLGMMTCVLLAITIDTGFDAIDTVRHGHASQDWPGVVGTVERAEQVLLQGRRNKYWSFELRYRYTVDGKQYTGERIGYGIGRYGDDEVRSYVRDYQVGQDVLVHYSRFDPATATLLRGVHPVGYWSLLQIVAGLVLTACMALFFAAVLTASDEEFNAPPHDPDRRPAAPPPTPQNIWVDPGNCNT